MAKATFFHIMRTHSSRWEILRRKIFSEKVLEWKYGQKKERYTRTNTLLQIPFSLMDVESVCVSV
jgi:hypothetical protein